MPNSVVVCMLVFALIFCFHNSTSVAEESRQNTRDVKNSRSKTADESRTLHVGLVESPGPFEEKFMKIHENEFTFSVKYPRIKNLDVLKEILEREVTNSGVSSVLSVKYDKRSSLCEKEFFKFIVEFSKKFNIDFYSSSPRSFRGPDEKEMIGEFPLCPSPFSSCSLLKMNPKHKKESGEMMLVLFPPYTENENEQEYYFEVSIRSYNKKNPERPFLGGNSEHETIEIVKKRIINETVDKILVSIPKNPTLVQTVVIHKVSPALKTSESDMDSGENAPKSDPIIP